MCKAGRGGRKQEAEDEKKEMEEYEKDLGTQK